MATGPGAVDSTAGAALPVLPTTAGARSDQLLNPEPIYSQRELDAKLLAAANTLRGPIDPADFKAYIFPLLFLKRISDNWHWEHARAVELFERDEDLAALPDNYRFVVPTGCLWEDVLALHENVGAGLQLVFDRLQEANPDTLAGVFGTAQWANKTVLPEERLTSVLDVFTGMKLDPDSVTHDLLGNGYEYLLKNFADESGKKAGEFFTPRGVVRLMVQLLGLAEGQSVYDPTCGSGGMLVESVNHLRAQGQDPRTLRLYGQDVQATTAAIARMNLYFHEIETFSIKRGDALRDPRFRDPSGSLSQFDLVLANPPFSVGKDTPWGHETWADDPWGRSHWGVPPKSYADMAFVEHMLVSLKPKTGRLATVMPHGVLFRGSERSIREALLTEGLITGVVGLPANLFYNTPQPACLLFCQAPGHAPADSVLLVDASARFRKGQPKNVMSEEDIAAVVSAYRTREAGHGVNVRTVSPDEIRDKDWSLNLGLYLDLGSESDVELAVAMSAYDETRVLLEEATKQLGIRLQLTGLSDA
jgi:type I restriction enzyme M protein